jgi:hypothetical protein
MGYRIRYEVGARTMQATVSGKASLLHAACIARDIAGEAAARSVKQLLIDVRGLLDRVGTLGTLVLGAAAPLADGRVAVVDSLDNERYHPFSEFAARSRGQELRYFRDSATALRWLHARRDA